MKTKSITFLSILALVFTLGLMPVFNSQALATGDDCMDEVCALIEDAQYDMEDAAAYLKKIGLIRRSLGKRQLRHAIVNITAAQVKMMKCAIGALPLDMIGGILPHNLAELKNLLHNVLPAMLPMIPDLLINPLVEAMTVEQVLTIAKIIVADALVDSHGVTDLDALNNIAVAQRLLDNLSICN